MSDLEKFFALDIKSGAFFIIACLIITVLIMQKWDWIIARFGIKTKRTIEEEEELNDIKELKQHAKQTDENVNQLINSIKSLHDTVDSISSQVQIMQEKEDATTRAKLKDRVGQLYRYYHERGEWTLMEKEAFNDLIAQYEAAGGANSFVHTICEPESMTWKIIDG